jgi:hypothetical protein
MQEAGIDLFQRTERRVRPGPHHTFPLSTQLVRCIMTVRRREQTGTRFHMRLLVGRWRCFLCVRATHTMFFSSWRKVMEEK